MAVKPIAVAADVSTEPALGTSPAEGYDVGGTWSQASLSVETRAVLTSAGAPVAWKASATFTYKGTTGGTTVSTSPPSSVTLAGSSSSLTCEGSPLLRDGDQAADSYGNRIVVSADGPLRSD